MSNKIEVKIMARQRQKVTILSPKNGEALKHELTQFLWMMEHDVAGDEEPVAFDITMHYDGKEETLRKGIPAKELTGTRARLGVRVFSVDMEIPEKINGEACTPDVHVVWKDGTKSP
jgi:hypothetical protein